MGIAAQLLKGQDWERFLEGLACRTHGDDKGVHSVLDSLLAKAESSWPAMLKKQTKLTSKNARVLFLGDPPSEPLCSIFQSNATKTLQNEVFLPLIGAGLPPVRKV